MSRRRLPILVAIATLLLAACTSGGSTTPPESTPVASAPAASEPAASEAAEGGACAPSTETGTVQASMEGFAFVPATITASVGDVISWTNQDSAPHTATVTDDPACSTANLGSGDSGGLTFSEPGSYAFFCKVHPNMTGTIEVN